MSYRSRDRKKRFRAFKRRYGKGDTQFDQWEIEQIHQIPETVELNQEFDFWAQNSNDVYLVTFENSPKNKIWYLRDNPRAHIYIRVCTQFMDLNIQTQKRLFSVISTLGIPYKSRINESKYFHRKC